MMVGTLFPLVGAKCPLNYSDLYFADNMHDVGTLFPLVGAKCPGIVLICTLRIAYMVYALCFP